MAVPDAVLAERLNGVQDPVLLGKVVKAIVLLRRTFVLFRWVCSF
jgi:hypothetical protein